MNAVSSRHEPSLLLVDDDATLCRVLSKALSNRSFQVTVAHDVSSAMRAARAAPPDYAVIDLKMPGPSGLSLIEVFRSLNSEMRIVVLTGYASISTSIEAIKLGATHYLAKAVDADEVVAALYRDSGDASVSLNVEPLSLRRLEWEHIQKVLADNNGNVSATARSLRMHLRTLQRKLIKRPVRE